MRSSTHAQDHKKIQELIDEYEVDCVVVGMPLNLSGKVGPAAKSAQEEINEMEIALSVDLKNCARLDDASKHEGPSETTDSRQDCGCCNAAGVA
jgi:putative transcription antitermination factor YqgF